MENKYITVSYKLYTIENGEKELVEEAPVEHPFQFISGIGFALDTFENEILKCAKGDNFDFTISCNEAYGERDEDNVRKVSKSIFCGPDGKFDEDNIFEGNVIMLNDGEGNQFYANVGEITENEVVLDLNHPHAGKDLNFVGTVVEMREPTTEEIQETLNMMSGGCSGGCGGCGGGCGEHDDEDGCGSCGCGGCH